jgi:hypothetical protein
MALLTITLFLIIHLLLLAHLGSRWYSDSGLLLLLCRSRPWLVV